MGERLLRGKKIERIYHTRLSPKLQIYVKLKSSPLGLHDQLDHPYLQVFKSITSKLRFGSNFATNVHCPSCLNNKN